MLKWLAQYAPDDSLLGGGVRDKGEREGTNWVTLLMRKLIWLYSTVKTQDSSSWIDPWNSHWLGRHLIFQLPPLQIGKGPGGGICLWEHSHLKWPSCLLKKHKPNDPHCVSWGLTCAVAAVPMAFVLSSLLLEPVIKATIQWFAWFNYHLLEFSIYLGLIQLGVYQVRWYLPMTLVLH